MSEHNKKVKFNSDVYDKLRKMNTDATVEFYVYSDDIYLKKALASFLEDNNLYTMSEKTDKKCVYINLKYGKYTYIKSYDNVEKLYELPYDWDDLISDIKQYLKDNPIEKKKETISTQEKMLGSDPLKDDEDKDIVENMNEGFSKMKNKIDEIFKSSKPTPQDEEEYNDAEEDLEEFKETTGYKLEGDFIFALTYNPDIGTEVSINPKIYWDNNGLLYDGHLSDSVLNLPIKFNSLMESVYEHEYDTDEEAIKALINNGFKFEVSFQEFIENSEGNTHQINGQSVIDYITNNYPDSIVYTSI